MVKDRQEEHLEKAVVKLGWKWVTMLGVGSILAIAAFVNTRISWLNQVPRLADSLKASQEDRAALHNDLKAHEADQVRQLDKVQAVLEGMQKDIALGAKTTEEIKKEQKEQFREIGSKIDRIILLRSSSSPAPKPASPSNSEWYDDL